MDHPDFKNIPFVVPPSPPREIIKASLNYALVSEALKAMNSLPSFDQMSEQDKLINYLFARREAVQSSRLEGTWSTIDHALTPADLLQDEKLRDDHASVGSYAFVMENFLEMAAKEKEQVFSIKLIKKLHEQIISRDPNSKATAGRLRTPGEAGSVVTIGGSIRKENSIYNPAPPEHALRCLEEFVAWLSDTELAQIGDAGAGMSLPVRLALGHSHFEAIHPFSDGNGRVGRALWPLQMACSNIAPLYLSGYVEAFKSNYVDVLENAQKKLDYASIVDFVCNAIIEARLEHKKTKEAINALYQSWDRRGQFRANSGAKRALELLTKFPIFSSETLQEKLSISPPAAGRAIKQLTEKKIIRSRETEKRKRIYAAEELIQILSRPFGAEVDLALEKAKRLF